MSDNEGYQFQQKQIWQKQNTSYITTANSHVKKAENTRIKGGRNNMRSIQYVTMRSVRTNAVLRSSATQLHRMMSTTSNGSKAHMATAAMVSRAPVEPVPRNLRAGVSMASPSPRSLELNPTVMEPSQEESSVPQTQLGFIGAGKMATAMIGGWKSTGMLTYPDVSVYDIEPMTVKNLKDSGSLCLDSASQVVKSSEIVFLSVKPDVISHVLDTISPHVDETKLIVSVAAGVTTKSIESRLPQGTRVVRVMPNTPSLVGMCASGYSRGTFATDADMERIGELLGDIGEAVQVPEEKLHAVTGVSGSGPAYVFLFIEAMADAGVRQGLSRDDALKLAAQTVKGAAEMVRTTGMHPGQLKDNVCSPGGTTIAAVESLEYSGFRASTMKAVAAATERSKELSKL